MSNYDFDLVEKLRDRASVSYEDAKAALDTCGGDLLEALIHLEKQGKVTPPAGGSYSSKADGDRTRAEQAAPPKQKEGDRFVEMWDRFCNWCGSVLHKGNTNHFRVWREGREIISVPVTVLVLLMICAFWVTLPLLVVGLFLDCRYSFSGNSSNIDVNGVMDSAANAAEALKNEVMSHSHDHDNHDK